MTLNVRKIADSAMTFLDAQRLPATPKNYYLAYMFVTGTHPGITQEVKALTDGGFRLSQEEATQIMETYGLGSYGSDAPEIDPGELLRHQLLRFADTSANQTDATNKFGDDLERMGATIADNAELSGMVSQMIEATNAARLELQKNAREIEQLRQDLEAAKNDAKIDALTNLPNRRAIDEILANVEARNAPVTIAFVDVDHFKHINDTHGHAVGDRVLKSLAEELRNACGEQGTIARWGGEEFVGVFLSDDTSLAFSIIDQARQSMSSKSLRVRETDQPLGKVTFSGGIATGRGDISAITAKADALLYRAKETGRNKLLAVGSPEWLERSYLQIAA